MIQPSSATLALGPLGAPELIVIAVILLIMAGMAAGIVFLVVHLNKKR